MELKRSFCSGLISRFMNTMVLSADRWSTTLPAGLLAPPCLACALLGCWLTAPFDALFDRCTHVFISCFIAAIAFTVEGVANSWLNLFIARFALGSCFRIKSATAPIYAAECSSGPIRAALVMIWRMRTAFGTMGNIMGVALLGRRQ